MSLKLALLLAATLVAAPEIGTAAPPRPQRAERVERRVAPPRAERPRGAFIRNIRVEGVSVIPQAEIDALAAPYEQREDTLQDLQALAKGIERRYHNKGYFLARVLVPEQRVEDGEVRLLVLEGRVGELLAEGSTYFTDGFLRRHMAPALDGGVLRERPFRRALLILNEFPDLRVQSVLEQGKQEGTVDVILKVTGERPLHLTLEYNNFGNRFVGRNRGGAAVTAGNVFRQGDGLTARATKPFPSESEPYLQFDYSLPVNNDGRRFGVQYASAASSPGAELSVLDIRGDADIFGFNFQFPLKRTQAIRSTLTAGFVAKSVDNFILGAVPLSNDEIRELAVNYFYNHTDGKHRAIFFAGITQGLGDTFGGTPDGFPLASRVGASNDFTKLNVDMARIHRVGDETSLILRANGQITGTPLLVPEQYALGGPESVRGYLQSQFLGDDGYLVSVDVRYDIYSDAPTLVQLAGFYDHGGVTLENPQVGEKSSRALTGAGVGVRANLFDGSTSLRGDIGFPISPHRNAEDDDYTLHVSAAVRI
jgi:hemolysin activation/secretion protein